MENRLSWALVICIVRRKELVTQFILEGNDYLYALGQGLYWAVGICKDKQGQLWLQGTQTLISQGMQIQAEPRQVCEEQSVRQSKGVSAAVLRCVSCQRHGGSE